MRITRLFTAESRDPYAGIVFETRTSVIVNEKGQDIFRQDNVIVPSPWSQTATDVLAQKYFRKRGVPTKTMPAPRAHVEAAFPGEHYRAILDTVPEELWPRVPAPDAVLGGENDLRQVADRLAGFWTFSGWMQGHFTALDDARAFFDEVRYTLVRQLAAPNSPQWFNSGLWWAYGVTGPSQGHYWFTPAGELHKSTDAYSHPALSACFIQGIEDDLVNDGGIMDLWTREARVFKFGGGSGANFSRVRGKGERLSGGGTSGGLMSFLKIGDRVGGSIKSGSTTRRAAKMVVLDIDHPDVEEFINWKVTEEQKVAMLVSGSRMVRRHLAALFAACRDGGSDLKTNKALRAAVRAADEAGVPLSYLERALQLFNQGYTEVDAPEYDADWQSEAYNTVSGQNSNNSVRVSDEFMKAVLAREDWTLIPRTTLQQSGLRDSSDLIPGAKFPGRQVPARKLWDDIAYAAWTCADPGLQFHTTINAWHTCPNDAPIRASNPCITARAFVEMKTGLVRVADLLACQEQEGRTFTIKIDGRFAEAELLKTGSKPIMRLVNSRGGYLDLTADHPVAVRTGDGDQYIAAGDLEPGMQLVESVNEVFDSVRAQFDERCFWLGYAYGDGWIAQDWKAFNNEVGICFGTDDKQALKAYTSYLQSKDLEFTCRRQTGSVGESPDYVRVHDDGYYRAYCRAGWSGKAKTKIMPRLALNNGRNLLNFLAGLLVSDGQIVYRPGKSVEVRFSSASQELMNDVHQALWWLGITSSVYDRSKDAESKFHYGDKCYSSSGVLYEVVVSGVNLRALAQMLPDFSMINERKSNQLRQVAEHPINNYGKNRRTVLAVKEVQDLGEVEDVYDFRIKTTDEAERQFFCNNIKIHNCSEYMFLDDTACNLASLNLVAVLGDDPRSQEASQRLAHTSYLWTVVLDISVGAAQYPSRSIAEMSMRYRTLGLGYANLGALLMRQGLPYDSDKARNLAGALTAALHCTSHRASADLSDHLEPFLRYVDNRDHMGRVIRNHATAALGESVFDGLNYRPQVVDHGELREDWHHLSELVTSSARWLVENATGGFRNAQVTLLAPTGTIGMSMDCDTTGVEPDFALVKFKKLAGGGCFTIINDSVTPALKHLGYTSTQIREIVEYCVGTRRLHQTDVDVLKSIGVTDASVRALNNALAGAFRAEYALLPIYLDEASQKALADRDFDPGKSDCLLRALTIKNLTLYNDVTCGRMTVEGAPYLKPEHYAVFDCANRCGRYGTRFIAPEAHVQMMAAVQPHLSGAISKTINMPPDSTVEQVQDMYLMSWRLGIKAVALYRDGSKLSQPLSTGNALSALLMEAAQEAPVQEAPASAPVVAAPDPVLTAAQLLATHAVKRRQLPYRRQGYTQKVRFGNHTLYIKTGEYPDGSLGEIFLTMSKEGAAFRGLLNAFAVAISIGLQHGVPLEEFCKAFLFNKFEPNGMVQGHDLIKMTTSIIDLVFRDLAITYLQRHDLIHSNQATREDLLVDTVGDDETPPLSAPESATRPSQRPGGSRLKSKVSANGNGQAKNGHGPSGNGSANGTAVLFRVNKKTEAREKGFEGDPCLDCGLLMMVRNGTCLKCASCGATSGCS
jgi:ribonucleoside-diphosphate reductase alpha chain